MRAITLLCALASARIALAATTPDELSAARERQLLDCWNAGSSETPDAAGASGVDFNSFLKGRPVRLTLRRVWWSRKLIAGDSSATGNDPQQQQEAQLLPLTVYTMASLDRLPLLEAQCKSYPGPYAAAVYVPYLLPPPAPAAYAVREGSGPGGTESGGDASRAGSGGGGGGECDASEAALAAVVRESRAAAAAGKEKGAAASGSAAAGGTEGAAAPSASCPPAMLRHALSAMQALFDRLDAAPAACAPVLLLLTEAVADATMLSLMPTNALRNAALLPAEGPLAAMIDVDLSASPGLARLAANSTRVSDLLSAARGGRGVWVVPAWEPHPQLPMAEANGVADEALAGSKRTLQRLWLGPGAKGGAEAGRLLPFATVGFPRGHGATDFRRWLDAGGAYEVPYQPGFEPWVLAARDAILPYDERFRGWYGDKFSQVMAMSGGGARFLVLPDAWLVHRPHPPTAVRAMFDGAAAGGSGGGGGGGGGLAESTVVRFWRRTKFAHYITRSRNLDHRQRYRQPRGWYEAQWGEAARRCRTVLPWWRPGEGQAEEEEEVRAPGA